MDERETMRRTLVVIAMVLGGMPPMPVVSAQTGVQPFYLERTLLEPDSSGNLVPAKIEIVARRSDGATARMESLGPLSAGQHMRTVVFSDGRSVTVFDDVKVKNT